MEHFTSIFPPKTREFMERDGHQIEAVDKERETNQLSRLLQIQILISNNLDQVLR